MKKAILLTYISIVVLYSNCRVFNNIRITDKINVRITNADTIETTGYRINDQAFPGLKPGDTTDYKLLGKLNEGDEFTIILDSVSYSLGPTYDCYNCSVLGVKKLTIGIKLLPKEQTNSKFPLVNVVFYFDEKK